MPPQAEPKGDSRVIAAAILLVTVVGIALSVSNPLLSLEMERWGTPSTISGLTATAAGFGTVIAVPLVPMLARRTGVPLMLGAALALSAVGMAAFHFVPDVVAWAILRFFLGAAIGIVFTLSEFWINAAADPDRRGFVMGLYATALYAGFAVGPPILALVGTTGALPYLVAAGLMAFGLVPLALVGSKAPRLDESPAGSVLRFILAVPTATFGALIFGAVETGMVIQLPVHNVRLGFAEADAALLLSAFTLGNVALQLPIGLVSDKVDRRKLLLALALISTLLALALPFGPPQFWTFAAILLALGGVSGAIYPVGLAYLGERFAGSDLASANAAFVLLYSVGLMFGPPAIGIGMDRAGALGLPLATAALLALYAGLVAMRLSRNPGRTRPA